MTESAEQAELDLLVDAAVRAGKKAMRYFRKDVEVWWKNEGSSPVTAADHAANDSLIHDLRRARPDYGWLSEESEDSAERLQKRRVFIVDPIDGTRAFMNGLDTWAVSVAIVDDGLPLAGVLYAPSLDELYVASRSLSATRNGNPLQTSAYEHGGRFRLSAADDMMDLLGGELKQRIERLSRIPSLAYRLAMIADGRMHATLVKPDAHDWDLAAADLILARAGGALTDLFGRSLRYNGPNPRHDILVASSENALQQELLARLAVGKGPHS